mgnify:CR=1 FL=1
MAGNDSKRLFMVFTVCLSVNMRWPKGVEGLGAMSLCHVLPCIEGVMKHADLIGIRCQLTDIYHVPPVSKWKIGRHCVG